MRAALERRRDCLHAAEHENLVGAVAQAMMCFTPATRAVTIDICAEATIG